MKAVLQRSSWLLLALFLVTECLQQYFMLIAQLSAQTQSANYFSMFGQMLVSLTEFIVLTMVIPQRLIESDKGVAPESSWVFLKAHIGPLTAEGLRTMGVVLMWSFLLILPGIFKYIRLLFVPFVVIADDEYKAGYRDALHRSNELIKGSTWLVFLICLVLTGLELLRHGYRTRFTLQSEPIFALSGGLVFFLLAIFANVLLFRFYQFRVKKWQETIKE